jgi:hypothetical protein
MRECIFKSILGDGAKPLRLMCKMMIPVFASPWQKRRHQNALHVTFISVQITCASIFVILMSLSSHLFIPICHMAVSCGKQLVCGDHTGYPFGTTTQFENMQ